MGKKARATRATAAPLAGNAAMGADGGLTLWVYLLSFAAVLYALFEVYGPALHGPFVFDDLYLPYADPHAASIPLRRWVGIRPVLGLSFWTDSQLWGRNTFPFHVMNLLLHFASAAVLFFVFRKLLALAQTAEPNRTILAAFGAALFLFHPIQTEVAAYVASRSETLSVLFFLGAFCAFLYRKTQAISWPATALVLFLFLLALGSKEHTVTLPAILLLTDYFWNPGFTMSGIRQNARLYVLIVLLGLSGAIFALRYIVSDPMIGFHIAGLGPGTYFLTECRAVFKYLQLFVLPVSQNVDYDFALSHTPMEHGALLAFAGLLLLVAAAFLLRKMYPFAAYGFLAFLVLLSPTSSFIPINDVLVERRLYLPFFALVLILFEPLRRVRIRPLYLASGLALICFVAAFASWNRAHVWGNVTELFRDAAAKSAGKPRVHIGYANALYHEGHCAQAVEEYLAATRLQTPDYVLYFNLGAAYDCTNQPDDAIMMLNRSNNLKAQANAFALIGQIQSKHGRWEESLRSLQSSMELNPHFAPAYAYRGGVYAAMGKPELAYENYLECLRWDPNNQLAQQGIASLKQRR